MKLLEAKRNALINVAGWLIPTIVFLALTPVMIERLGTDGFGVIVIIQILTGYMSILNFGFSEAIIKQVAENLERSRDHAVCVMWAGLGLFLAAGLAGAATIFFLSDWLVYELFEIPDNLRADAALALRIGAVIFLLQMLAEYYRGTAIGCNRFDIPSISRIVRISLSAILIYAALIGGGGLADVMLATLAGLIAGIAINAIWMQRSIPMNWISHGYRGIVQELFHFGKHILFSRLANMFSNKINQLMLGTLTSVSNVALYSVPVRAADAGSVIINKMMQVFYPGFSKMDKQQDISRIRSIYFSVISIQLFITTPLLIAVMLEGPTLLAVWIDQDFADQSSRVINLVAISYFIAASTNLPTFAAMSFNFPGLISRYSVYRVIIVAITVYPLVKYYGILGAAWTLLLAEMPAIPFLYESTRRVFNENFYHTLGRPIFSNTLIGLSLYLLYDLVYRNSSWYHPSAALVVIVIHLGLAYLFEAISNHDLQRLQKLATAW